MEEEELSSKITAAVSEHFGDPTQFIKVFSQASPTVSLLVKNGSVATAFSSLPDLEVEIYDLDLRSDGTTSLEQLIRSSLLDMAHTETEVKHHYETGDVPHQ